MLSTFIHLIFDQIKCVKLVLDTYIKSILIKEYEQPRYISCILKIEYNHLYLFTIAGVDVTFVTNVELTEVIITAIVVVL